MKNLSRHLLIAALGLALLTLGQSAAQAQTTVDVDYSWTAPTSGSPVDHYVVQHSVDGGAWYQVGTAASNSYTLSAEVGHSHRLRVAGVDAQSRLGEYSDPSDAYTPDPGPPGKPGKPILF